MEVLLLSYAALRAVAHVLACRLADDILCISSHMTNLCKCR